jgi:hypothetical protein
MHRSCCEQEAAENLLAVLGVTASGEAAQIATQMFEPAFTQVGGAQAANQEIGVPSVLPLFREAGFSSAELIYFLEGK